jgi:hypothetical protein
MSDSQPPRGINQHIASFILPGLCLALTLAAFAIGAPAKLASLGRPAPVLAALEFDSSIRYEPVVSADLSAFELVAAKRVLDGLVSKQFLAFK